MKYADSRHNPVFTQPFAYQYGSPSTSCAENCQCHMAQLGNCLLQATCCGRRLQKAKKQDSAIHLFRVQEFIGVPAVDLAPDEDVVQVRVDVAVVAELVENFQRL